MGRRLPGGERGTEADRDLSPGNSGDGIDGQSWSAVALDKGGQVLTNTPIWMDTRAQEICDRLNEEIGAETIFQLAGNSLQPSYTTAKVCGTGKPAGGVWKDRQNPAVQWLSGLPPDGSGDTGYLPGVRLALF